MTSCPDCGHQVSRRAVTCPSCGAPLQPQTEPPKTATKWVQDRPGGRYHKVEVEQPPPSTTQPAPPAAKKGIGCSGVLLWIMAGALALFGLLVMFGSMVGDKDSGTRTSTNSKVEDHTWEACRQSQDFVKKVLVAPATAEFPSCNEVTKKRLEGNTYQVVGWVDSQNKFGAMLRTNYICTMELKNGYWHLKERVLK